MGNAVKLGDMGLDHEGFPSSVEIAAASTLSTINVLRFMCYEFRF